MYLKAIIVTIISISFARAADINLTYGLFKYHYSSNQELLQMKGKQLDLKLAKNECNAVLVKNFEARINKTIDTMDKQLSPLPEGMEIILGENKTYQSKTTAAGKFFLRLPKEFKKLLTANKFKCLKK